MLDRFGNIVLVGWPEHHLVWIEAALTLDRKEHSAAFRDIADLTGRSVQSVQSKAYAIQKARLEARPERRIIVINGVPGPARNVLPPSQLEPVSMARKMGAKA